MWLPDLLANQASAQGAANPISGGSVILLDGGWTTGQTRLRVLAAPQVLAWTPGQRDAAWATETGFLYGGLCGCKRRQAQRGAYRHALTASDSSH